MNSLAIRALRDSLVLTDRQRQLLEGMLLGDAHLERQSGRAVARLKIEHSQSQAAYVDWKYHEWRDWVLTPPSVRRKTSRPGTQSLNIGFSTLSHGELEEVRQRFYPEGRKVVPFDVMVTPLSLAVWFMDDGSRKSRECRGLYLNTQGFSALGVETLREHLRAAYGLRTTQRQQSDGLQIYVPADVVERFVEIVHPHMHPSMCYKLPG